MDCEGELSGSNNAERDGKPNLLVSVKVSDALQLNNRVMNLSRYEAFERPVLYP